MIDKTERARLLATLVHLGQKRQDGEDYINHCKRIVSMISHNHTVEKCSKCHVSPGCYFTCEQRDVDLICAAWLHDCIEDAPIIWEMNDVILHMFGYDIWDIVITLTHDKKIESYNDYITRVFRHPIAWQIKWMDMEDNTNYDIPDKQKTKYRDACLLLICHGIKVPEILKERLNL